MKPLAWLSGLARVTNAAISHDAAFPCYLVARAILGWLLPGVLVSLQSDFANAALILMANANRRTAELERREVHELVVAHPEIDENALARDCKE